MKYVLCRDRVHCFNSLQLHCFLTQGPKLLRIGWFEQAEELISRIDLKGKKSISAEDTKCGLLKRKIMTINILNGFIIFTSLSNNKNNK